MVGVCKLCVHRLWYGVAYTQVAQWNLSNMHLVGATQNEEQKNIQSHIISDFMVIPKGQYFNDLANHALILPSIKYISNSITINKQMVCLYNMVFKGTKPHHQLGGIIRLMPERNHILLFSFLLN